MGQHLSAGYFYLHFSLPKRKRAADVWRWWRCCLILFLCRFWDIGRDLNFTSPVHKSLCELVKLSSVISSVKWNFRRRFYFRQTHHSWLTDWRLWRLQRLQRRVHLKLIQSVFAIFFIFAIKTNINRVENLCNYNFFFDFLLLLPLDIFVVL